MRDKISLGYSFEVLVGLAAAGAVVAVLYTFIIGRHFIIPTGILIVALLLGHLAWYGLQGRSWAKRLLFWAGFVATAHAVFALFWAKRYRELLGDAFEPVCVLIIVLLGFLSFQYARRNRLFQR